MAAISIILPTISVVTSGTSLISDSIKEKSFKLKRNKKYEDLLSLISREHKAYGYSYEAYFLKSDIVSKLFEYCQTSLTDEESCVNGGNFDNTAHYLSCNFWHIFNIRLNKREII
jgi:hypothetical protein